MSLAGTVHRTNRILHLSLQEATDLVIAQWFLLAALWTVRRRAKGELLRAVRGGGHPDHPRDGVRLARLAVAVDRVARFGVFRPTCLVRAVALERLVRRARAGRAVVRVGVLKQEEQFFAHAWIEIDGRVVGDEAAHVRRFTPLDDFSALPE